MLFGPHIGDISAVTHDFDDFWCLFTEFKTAYRGPNYEKLHQTQRSPEPNFHDFSTKIHAKSTELDAGGNSTAIEHM